MILIPNQTQSAVTPCASGRLQWFGPNMPPRITIFPETWPYQNLRPFFILKSFITWNMHWRRNHSGYWISFQTHKENIFQSWNENLINVSRSSYKCTFWSVGRLENHSPIVLFYRPLQSTKNIFCVDVSAQICYSLNWILFMALQRPTFNSQIHTSLYSRNKGICVFIPSKDCSSFYCNNLL